MDPLLIVLAIGCALASVAYAARGLRTRSRTVERHQQALGTLADITQGPDGPQGWSEEPTHQAHVRVIGPSGQVTSATGAALRPPRALSSPGSANPSPFRRPSRTAPSVAAMDAVATSANLGRSPGAQVLHSGTARPMVRSLPGHEPAEATLPGLPPEPGLVSASALAEPGLVGTSALAEPGLSGEPTRPVPVVAPQVFQFDDLSPTRGKSAKARGGPARLEKLRLATRHFGRRPSITGVVLAAAAVAVAVAAVGIALDLRSTPSQARSQFQAAARQAPVTTVPTPTRKASPPTTLPVPTTPPATVASYPAVLVSSSGGTATYQLSSPSASIVVRAKGRCWLEVRANSPLGQIVYEGILDAGQQSSVTGPAWLRVGDPPEVAVRVNGQKMPVPGAAVAEPLNLQFSLG